jgi:polyphosphate kinase
MIIAKVVNNFAPIFKFFIWENSFLKADFPLKERRLRFLCFYSARLRKLYKLRIVFLKGPTKTSFIGKISNKKDRIAKI